MAVVHKTTMSPGKLELLATWLPAQPWYLGAGEPELTRAGGFRLDDPAGEVGIEFMVVADAGAGAASGDVAFYQVPMTYRGQPLYLYSQEQVSLTTFLAAGNGNGVGGFSLVSP